MPEPETIVDVLTSDHRALAAELEQLQALLESDPGAEVTATIDRLVTQLVGLLVAEEQYLLPAVRASVAHGARSAEQQFDRHRQLEHQLRRLEDLEATPALVVPILREVSAGWRQLTAYLDVEIFPLLQRELPPDRLAHLGREVLGAIATAPTRPRGFAPRSAELSKLVGLATGFVDRARDSWSGRGQGADDASDPEHDAP